MNDSSIIFNEAEYVNNGFTPPIDILNTDECKELVRYIKKSPKPLDWQKGLAVTSLTLYNLAYKIGSSEIMSRILGDNIILWGASVIKRRPGSSHQWHTDIETYNQQGKTVSIWIALENTNINSSLKFISTSHKFGICVQHVASKMRKRRNELNDILVEKWAADLDPESKLIQQNINDGQAIIFDGSIWHASNNTNQSGTRTALLLQYARSDIPIRIYTPSNIEWPFEYIEHPKPPCIFIKGEKHHNINRIVAPPVQEKAKTINRIRNRSPRLTNCIRQLNFPLKENKETGWRSNNIFKGSSDIFEFINCHISVLSPGKCPHPPHKHKEEELLIMLSGEADVVLHGYNKRNSQNRFRLNSGSFIYYPSNYIHTIDNTTSDTATYLMFKWRNILKYPRTNLPGERVVKFTDQLFSDKKEMKNTLSTSKLMECPTGYLRKLHCHFSTMLPGGGYEPHSDNYDVGIIVLSGQLKTLETLVKPYDLIYYSAGQKHGLVNTGDTPAKYIVFEFHKRKFIPSLTTIKNIIKKTMSKFEH